MNNPMNSHDISMYLIFKMLEGYVDPFLFSTQLYLKNSNEKKNPSKRVSEQYISMTQ